MTKPPAQAEKAGSGQLVLASASPQRRAILERLGVSFTVRPARVAERTHGGTAAQLAEENARRKAHAAQAHAGELVLACDTLVSLAGTVYGKPAGEREARAMLGALSGATHEVVSAVVLLEDGAQRAASARTAVTFRALDERMIAWYLAGGEWRGRAGGYAIQGAGAALVRCVEGDYENVVGLPVATLLDLYPQLLVAS